MKEIEISAVCYSEKEDVSVGCGIYFDAEAESIGQLDSDWIGIGMSESFWENYEDFEPGIDKAKRLIEGDSNLTYRQALYSVFGNFNISYEVDGKESNLEFEIDANEFIYNMLEYHFQ